MKLLQYVRDYSLSLVGSIISFLLPPRCFVTGEAVDQPGLLSAAAWEKLQFVARPYCACCGIPFEMEMAENSLCVDCLEQKPSFVRARAPLVYNDASKPIILPFKHNDKLEAAVSLAPLMASVLDDLQTRIDFIVPVPLHWRKLLQRRYNQSAVLAQHLGGIKKIPVLVDALVRIKNTESQGGKKRDERLQNVKNAFAAHQRALNKIRDRSILLIDDVMTTGATVDACAKALIEAGASNVYVVCVARVPKRDFQVPDLAA